MTQRLSRRLSIEITGLEEQNEIGTECAATQNMLTQLAEFCRHQAYPAECQAGEAHEDQCGEDSANPAAVEIEEAEVPSFKAFEYDSGYQESRYDKEDVDTDEAAWEAAGEGVIQ
jgi:hypothetical protein